MITYYGYLLPDGTHTIQPDYEPAPDDGRFIASGLFESDVRREIGYIKQIEALQKENRYH